MLPALEARAKAPGGAAGVENVVGRRLALYPPPEMSEGAFDAWWGDYIDTLSDLPESALEAGMQAWIKRPDSRFMPKPGELRQLALSAENKAVRAYWRAKSGVEYQAPRTYEARHDIAHLVQPRTPPTAADKANVRRMLAEFQGKVTVARPKVEPPPPPFGAVDEGGITPALRKIMEARSPR